MIWIKKKPNQNILFISIGGGINQLPLIEEAKKLGMHIIGVDRDIRAAGMHRCDIRIQESIENYNEIYQKLKDLLAYGEIAGVMTKSFGQAIKTASYISGKLSIPLLPFERADDFIYKDRMKKIFKINNIKSPDSYTYIKKNVSKKIPIPYPFIIKPIVGHAKNDVELIQDAKNFKRYIKSLSSKNENYIIEKYIEGDEVIAVGIVQNGIFYLVEMTDKLKSAPPYFVDIMHVSPSKYNHLRNDIQKIGQSIADSFEIKTSPLLLELIISKNNEINLIETAPEFGGEFLSDILIPETTGYNIIEEAIRAVINKNFNPPPAKRKFRNAVVVKYITGKKGTLLSFNPIKIKHDGIIYSRIFKDIGSAIKKASTNHDRIGVVITKGKTAEEAKERAVKAEKELNIKIKNSRDG